MSKSDTEAATVVLAWLTLGPIVVGLFILWAVACSLWEAYAVWRIYGWHLLPLGAPVIPFTAIVAADMILTLMTTHLIPDRDAKWAAVFLRPMPAAVMLAVAWWLL